MITHNTQSAISAAWQEAWMQPCLLAVFAAQQQ